VIGVLRGGEIAEQERFDRIRRPINQKWEFFPLGREEITQNEIGRILSTWWSPDSESHPEIFASPQ